VVCRARLRHHPARCLWLVDGRVRRPAAGRDLPRFRARGRRLVPRGVTRLRNVPAGLWCGEQDGFYDDVRALAETLSPVAGSFGAGEHIFGYWSRCLPAALDFLARQLTPA